MDQNQIDLFLASFMGGVVGGGILMTAMYHYFKSIYIRHRESKDSFWDVIALKRMENDVEKLKKGMSDLSKEIYDKYDAEEQ
jgi:hypothetical protein